jgi:hypothetical protein
VFVNWIFKIKGAILSGIDEWRYFPLSKPAFIGFCLVFGIHIFVFLFSASLYPGSTALYGCYSIVSALALYLGFYRRFDYGTPVLSIFLWLGGWFKLVVHVMIGYSYVEPTGGFSFSADHYDEMLVAGVIANIAISIVWIVSKRFIKTDDAQIDFGVIGDKFQLKILNFRVVLVAIFVCVAAINIFNVYAGMYQTGIVAKTIFPWPINAVFGWILSMGLSMVISTLLFWAILSKRGIVTVVLFAIFEAMLSAGSVLSRGLYVVHLLPVFYSLWMNRLRLTLGRYSLLFLATISIVAFAASGAFVNIARNFAYNEEVPLPVVQLLSPTQNSSVSIIMQSPQVNAARMALSESGAFASQGLISLSKLAVDRWIGIEGLMAAVGYPSKSLQLWGDLLMEKPAIGYITKYQYISNAGYINIDANRFQFLTLSGPAGMFYLSGSLFVVFVGMAFLALLAILIERWVWVMTGNPFLCAIIGVWMANGVAQFGVAPRQLLIQLVMHCIGVIFIAGVQSWWLNIGWFSKTRGIRA